MIDLIYNFILNTFIGSGSTLPNIELMATLLTWGCVVLLFFGLVKLFLIFFRVGSGKWRN